MSDYLDVVAFIEGSNGKKFPRKIGKVKIAGLPPGAKGNLYLDVIPIGWNGSAAIEEQKEYGQRGAGGGSSNYQSNDAPGRTSNREPPPF